jgi:hypothetical protein
MDNATTTNGHSHKGNICTRACPAFEPLPGYERAGWRFIDGGEPVAASPLVCGVCATSEARHEVKMADAGVPRCNRCGPVARALLPEARERLAVALGDASLAVSELGACWAEVVELGTEGDAVRLEDLFGRSLDEVGAELDERGQGILATLGRACWHRRVVGVWTDTDGEDYRTAAGELVDVYEWLLDYCSGGVGGGGYVLECADCGVTPYKLPPMGNYSPAPEAGGIDYANAPCGGCGVVGGCKCGDEVARFLASIGAERRELGRAMMAGGDDFGPEEQSGECRRCGGPVDDACRAGECQITDGDADDFGPDTREFTEADAVAEWWAKAGFLPDCISGPGSSCYSHTYRLQGSGVPYTVYVTGEGDDEDSRPRTLDGPVLVGYYRADGERSGDCIALFRVKAGTRAAIEAIDRFELASWD